jgi:hypothetical protein
MVRAYSTNAGAFSKKDMQYPQLGRGIHACTDCVRVFAHPEPRSFNGALKDLAVETLTAPGHKVRVSDLYTARFGAVTGAADFLCERADPVYFSIAQGQTHAYKNGAFAAEYFLNRRR